jgi:hypothetical protein
VRLEGLGKLKKIHLIGTRTRDVSACSIVPQSTTLPRAPKGTKAVLFITFPKYSENKFRQFSDIAIDKRKSVIIIVLGKRVLG